MNALLSEEQRQSLRAGGLPLEVKDAETDQVFYLVSEEGYRKLRRILEKVEEVDPSYFEFTEFRATE